MDNSFKESVNDPIGFFGGVLGRLGRVKPIDRMSVILISDSPRVIRLSYPGRRVSPKWQSKGLSRKVMRFLGRVFRESGGGVLNLFFMPIDALMHPALPSEWLRPRGPLHQFLHQASADDERRAVNAMGRLLRAHHVPVAFDCALKNNRPCEPHPDPAVPVQIEPYSKKTMVHYARRCGFPEASPSTPIGDICDAVQAAQPRAIASEHFVRYFRGDLLEGLKRDCSFIVVMKGGSNLRVLLRDKLGDTKTRILTNDLDFTVSNAGWGMPRTIRHWEKRLRGFMADDPLFKGLFSLKKTVIPRPDDRGGLCCILQLQFKFDDFVDFSFTTHPIPRDRIDRPLSKKTGLPISRLDYAVRDLFDVIVRENIAMIDPMTFRKRNPLHGSFRAKGIRDLYRARVMCRSIAKHFSEPSDLIPRLCSLTKNLTIGRLETMDEESRNRIFFKIAAVLS